MTDIQLDYTDITDIFKEKLHVNNIVKKISTIFLNSRYAAKINYKPYFQRNYVWDNDKATYFIESILLGTEIPPLVLFQTKDKNEVIDGRQRYETIERFLNDKFALTENGLHCLKTLSGKKYSQLSDSIREQFEETRIRILQFQVVNEPKLADEKEDKIKKEIFRRYNSGITSLSKAEIERAVYINDEVCTFFYERISNDNTFLTLISKYFLPVSKEKVSKRDRINILLMRIRTLLALPFIPIYSYAHSGSHQDIISKYYNIKVKQGDPNKVFENFSSIVQHLKTIDTELTKKRHQLSDNKLFYEVLYWGISVVINNSITITKSRINSIINELLSHSEESQYWERIINNPNKDVTLLFESTGSHYYSSINNRYNYIANIFTNVFKIDFSKYLKDAESFKCIMSSEMEDAEVARYQLNMPLPESLTIEDVIADMEKNRFLVRPKYQRSEVKNLTKASYLLESILLGINIPPLFIFKRSDRIKEVVDGQQRILSILGFLGEKYRDENGELVSSNKHQFKLTKLKILSELNGLDVNSIPQEFKDKILEFPLDVIEIDCANNPEFNQTDLFTRLNSKPYPIADNTFEMWNAYVDKDIILKIKELAQKYATVIFRATDTRMKVEELITSLAYLDYRLSQANTDIKHILNVYKKNDRLCARIMSKETVTKTLSDVSNTNSDAFIRSVTSVEDFAHKVKLLTEYDPKKFQMLFAHSRKGTQYKTDQNFYFLWIMLYQLDFDFINHNRDKTFVAISKMYELIQKSPENFTVSTFF